MIEDGRPATKRAAVLRYAAAHRYPVPTLYDATGADLILKKLDGPEMQEALRPWNFGSNARILADLHRRLHLLPPMPDLESLFDEPRSLLHLDLHPRNVLPTSRGPVVIDWTNAANGPGQADVALVHVIGATAQLDGPVWRRAAFELKRVRFLDAFRDAAADAEFAPVLPVVAAWRKRDPNVTATERAAIDRLLERVTLEA